MPKFVKTTSVHEKTVQAVASRTAEFDKKFELVPGSKGRYRRRRNSRVVNSHPYDQLNPMLKTWLKKNCPHWSRVAIESPTSIVITNVPFDRRVF